MELLRQISDQDKVSLLIRHGDRDKIPEGSFGNEVMLNEKGKENSLNFGESLSGYQVNRILTSPVGRCVQTAEYIMKGYGRNIEITESIALGGPGLHINDEKLAGDFFLKRGFDEMYDRYIRGIEIPGIPDMSVLNGSISSFLTENTTDTGLTIFVTHDMLIAFYHFSINKTVYTKDNWINYLSGLILKNGKYEK